jgi:hypothetical protein
MIENLIGWISFKERQEGVRSLLIGRLGLSLGHV